MEVFKVLSQDRIQQLCMLSRPLTFQFQVVQEAGGVEVFKVLSQDRIQQQCTLSRPLTFQFHVVQEAGGVEVFKVLLDRVQQPLHLTLVLLMTLGKEFFALFPGRKKVRSEVRARGRNWVRTLNPSTLSAHQMPPEQLVDVPVPLVHERLGSRELLLVFRRLQEEEEEVNLWRVHNALQGVEQMDEVLEEEVVEVSRFLPHFRPRRWCWYVLAGNICPRGWNCTFAHHESELHPDSW